MSRNGHSSNFENAKISLNNKNCSLYLKRTDNSCIMLKDISFYLAISYSISNLGLKVPVATFKNALFACRSAFKSALLACCHALKVPFFWKLYHALFGGWGKHYMSALKKTPPKNINFFPSCWCWLIGSPSQMTDF